jgi:DNA repair exonuclease SbcCD ATPase subunit
MPKFAVHYQTHNVEEATMKKGIIAVAMCTMLVFGCNQKEEELQKQVVQLQAEQTSLQQNLSERDKYLEEVMHSINEVYADLEAARVKEAKLVERTGTEGPLQIAGTDTRQKLLQNITDIGSTLKENRKKIADLQAKMKSFRGEIASLNKLITNLKESLLEREQSIAALESRVAGLETSLTEKTKVLAEKENVIEEQQRSINTGYYVAGTSDELESRGVITDEGGFLWGLLGSTTLMASGVDQSLFKPIDKTREGTIHVQGRIKEILPRRNEAYFAMTEPEGNLSTLRILQPEKFWQDKYLVIIVDQPQFSEVR